MKGNLSKKKGLLSEIKNEHLDYISDKLYGKVGITREDFEKLKEETAAVKVYADKSKEQAVKEASELIMKEVSDNYYNKTVTDNKISSVFKYCGSVEFEHDLPNYKVGENVGHVYNILKSNDDLNEPKPLIWPSINDVEWYGKVSLINDIQYLTVKDKNGNDITQSLPSGIMLQHSELESINDFSQFLIFLFFRLDTKTDNGWTFSVYNEQSFEMMDDKVNITFERCMQDFLEPKAGDNVVWNGYTWDILSGIIDLGDYATKEDVAKAIFDSWGVGV